MAQVYEPGMTLEVRGGRWTLTRAQAFDACTVLTLGGADASNESQSLQVIEPFDRPRLPAARRLRRRPRRTVLRTALNAITSARTTTGLWTAADAAIDVMPYQLEPALAVLGGATRILLADAVGLGKTIQAGLVLSELRARGWTERALIVCPAGLRDTWARELRERFRIDSTIVDQAALAERAASLPPGVNPWCGDAVAIASIDLIKRPEVLAAVDAVPIDLLIADEAHHLTPGTDRGDAISRLAARAPWVVLMSATPHSGDAAAFSYLTNIGSHGDRLMVFRRTRRHAGIAAARRTHLLPVQADARQRVLFDALDGYVRAIWRGRAPVDPHARLLAITLARRAASSTLALQRTLTRRMALLDGHITEPAQTSLPWEEIDHGDDEATDAVIGARGLDDTDAELSMVRRLIELAATAGEGAKMRRLLRILRAIREPAIVFTEYRDSLDAIASRLPASTRTAVIHGGVPLDLRRATVDAFNNDSVDVLIATDAVGEGLNLHHRCRLVIDFELPWNPLRLEQRIGRVDRIGQRRVAHAIRLFHRGTIEERVLDHLGARRRQAEHTLDRYASESDIATAAFDGTPLSDGVAPRIRGEEIARATEEAHRVQQRRRCLALGAGLSVSCWASRRRTSSLMTILRATATNHAGCVVGEAIMAHHIQLRRSIGRKEWPTLVRQLSELLSTASLPEIERPPVASFEARIGAIRAGIAARRHTAYQRSLFDSRAEAAANASESIAASLDTAVMRTLRAVASPLVGRPRIDVIAAWPERRL